MPGVLNLVTCAEKWVQGQPDNQPFAAAFLGGVLIPRDSFMPFLNIFLVYNLQPKRYSNIFLSLED